MYFYVKSEGLRKKKKKLLFVVTTRAHHEKVKGIGYYNDVND